MDPEFKKMLEAAKMSELLQKQQQDRELQLQQLQLMQHQRQALQPQQMQILEEIDQSTTVLSHIQQALATGAAPSMVVVPTHIPLYPGYNQVPAGVGFIKDNPKSKYYQLLQVINELNRELRPSYAGNKISSEKFKRGIAQARILLRECMMEHSPSNQR